MVKSKHSLPLRGGLQIYLTYRVNSFLQLLVELPTRLQPETFDLIHVEAIDLLVVFKNAKEIESPKLKTFESAIMNFEQFIVASCVNRLHLSYINLMRTDYEHKSVLTCFSYALFVLIISHISAAASLVF